MASRNVLRGKQIESAMSLAGGDTQSAVFNIPRTIMNVGIIIETSSVTDNTGTFDVQYRINTGDETTGWATLTLGSTPTLADADATFLINLNQIPPGDIRIAYNNGGGTPDGTAAIWIAAGGF